MLVALGSRRQSAAHSPWMTFSAPTPRRASGRIGLAATGLLIFEPLAWFAYKHGALAPGFVAVSIAEISVGVAVAAALVASRHRSVS